MPITLGGARKVTLGAERSEEVHQRAPLLAEALPLIGHPAIRSQGTVGGSLAHADPSAELPAVAIALGAQLVAQSQARGTRTISADDFFIGFFQTALEPDEILTGVVFPAPATGTGSAIAEVARRHGDFAMVGAAAAVRVEAGKFADARLVLTGVSATPWRASAVEAVLMGADATDAAIAEAAGEAATGLSPPADVHGSSSYRRHVAGVLARRTLTVATRRAQEAA
jgi:carbon-monoxide dehydrogenase medium subunit